MIVIEKPTFRFEHLKLGVKPTGLTPDILNSFIDGKRLEAKEALITVEQGPAKIDLVGTGDGHSVPAGFTFILRGPGNLKRFRASAIGPSKSSLSITYFE